MPSSDIKRMAVRMEKVPIRLAMKFGVSLARTMPLPRLRSQKSASASRSSGKVAGPGINSSSFIYRGGLKKCVPAQCCWKSASKPSAIWRTGSPEVLVVTIVPGRRWLATRCSSFRLISRFSGTTSMIQSAWAHQSRLSSKFPMVIRAAADGVKNAAGRDLRAASSPPRAMRFRTIASLSVKPRALSPAVNSDGTISNSQQGTLKHWPNGPRCARPWCRLRGLRLFRCSFSFDSLVITGPAATPLPRPKEGYRTGKNGSTDSA